MAGTTAIGSVTWRDEVTVVGRVKLVQLGASAGRSLEVQIFDETGGLRLLFMGRTRIPGVVPGAVLRATGRVGEYRGHPAIANPIEELVDSVVAAVSDPVQRPSRTNA
jgi:DNA/RNA endonuclease YhcR with UshA esterase domain